MRESEKTDEPHLAGEVPMDDALGVQVLHAAGDVPRYGHPHRLLDLLLLVVYDLVQRSRVYVLCEGVQLALVYAYAHQAEHVRVRQSVHQLDLLEHVPTVGVAQVHLQHHHLAGGLVRHLRTNRLSTWVAPTKMPTQKVPSR